MDTVGNGRRTAKPAPSRVRWVVTIRATVRLDMDGASWAVRCVSNYMLPRYSCFVNYRDEPHVSQRLGGVPARPRCCDAPAGARAANGMQSAPDLVRRAGPARVCARP